MAINSRQKGAAWEREVARRFRAVLGLPAESRQVRRAGGGQADGAKMPDVDVPHLWIECKVGPKQDPQTALEQAEWDCMGTDRAPVAVLKHDRKPPFAYMRTSTWAALCDSTIGNATDCSAGEVPLRVDLEDLLMVYASRVRAMASA